MHAGGSTLKIRQHINVPVNGAIDTGEWVKHDGRDCKVYRELKPVQFRSKLIPRRDRHGEIIWKVGAGGVPTNRPQTVVHWHTPKWVQQDESVQLTSMRRRAYGPEGEPDGTPVIGPDGEPAPNPEAWAEFVQEGHNNGVRKIYNFRDDPETRKRLERERQIESRGSELIRTLAEADITPADLTRIILDARGREIAPQATPNETVVSDTTITPDKPSTAVHTLHDRGGNWYDVLGPDGNAVNPKAMREADALKLIEELG